MSLLICFLFLIHNVSFSLASYEYFKLVQQWPPTFCQRTPCYTTPNRFTIHGLWPSNFSNPQPTWCSPTQPLDPNRISILQTQLQIDWPDLYGNDLHFWDWEWRKHGICSINRFSDFNYFWLALDIKSRKDIQDILALAGISPNSTATYSRSSIANAIKSEIGVDPQLLCKKNPPSASLADLAEVGLCIDYYGQLFIPCPVTSRGCGKQIRWPT